MAKKITELTELTTYATNDLLIIEDVSTSTTKKITWANLVADSSITTAKLNDAAVTPAKLLAGTGSSWVWQTWAPTWANFTIGNGTSSYTYTQIGKTVFYKVMVTLGSTSSMGSGATFTLPVTAVSYLTNGPIGQINAIIAGGNHIGFVGYQSTTVAVLFFAKVDSTYAFGATTTSLIPNTWANGSILGIMGTYEAA